MLKRRFTMQVGGGADTCGRRLGLDDVDQARADRRMGKVGGVLEEGWVESSKLPGAGDDDRDRRKRPA